MTTNKPLTNSSSENKKFESEDQNSLKKYGEKVRKSIRVEN